MTGRWERLWRVTCAGCGRWLTWTNDHPEVRFYPTLADAQMSAEYAGWRETRDGWRCEKCLEPQGRD
jgi:hypothetical protein